MKPAIPNGKKFEYDNKFSKDPMNLEGIWLYQVGELYAEAGLKMNTHMQDCHEISYIVSDVYKRQVLKRAARLGTGNLKHLLHRQGTQLP